MSELRHLEVIETIKKKLVGKRLTYKEIFNLMDEIAHHRLSDVLTTYFVAAGFTKGFTSEELYFLTKAIVETGTSLEFSGIVADKHSTGGVAGTRASMIIVPIIAAAGYKIPKTSSRAITTPAGTADVMEVFAPVTFVPEKIKDIIDRVGGCIVWGGHLGIAPADDVIIKIEEPLSFESFDKVIVSIMAKKVAVGTNHVVFDIPYGKTMKIKTHREAEQVSNKFKALGKHFGMKVITYINQTAEPGGNGVGPFLEAMDVLKVLEQNPDRSEALEERALTLAGMLLDACFETDNIKKSGIEEAKKLLKNGSAWKKFLQIIQAQGGNSHIISHQMKNPAYTKEIIAPFDGKIRTINNFNLNSLAKILGAPKDKYAGIYLHKKTDQEVKKGQVLLTFYARSKYNLHEALETLEHFPIVDIVKK